MRYRKLSASGDYVIGSGGDFHINNPEGVAQAILTRLKLWRGEWFINIADGTPWLQDILGKRQRGKSPDGAIKKRILETEGVKEILSYSSNYDGNSRQLQINATIATIYGIATINERL